MCADLWQAVRHGEQGRTKTRSQEAAQEKTAEACRESGGDADRLQTNRAKALTACCRLARSGKRASTREMRFHRLIYVAAMLLLGLTLSAGLRAGEKTLWKPVAFAIFKFNG